MIQKGNGTIDIYYCDFDPRKEKLVGALTRKCYHGGSIAKCSSLKAAKKIIQRRYKTFVNESFKKYYFYLYTIENKDDNKLPYFYYISDNGKTILRRENGEKHMNKLIKMIVPRIIKIYSKEVVK